jgi:hypothetical protein
MQWRRRWGRIRSGFQHLTKLAEKIGVVNLGKVENQTNKAIPMKETTESSRMTLLAQSITGASMDDSENSSLTRSQIDDLRLAASKMNLVDRRSFQAAMTLKYCEGKARLQQFQIQNVTRS